MTSEAAESARLTVGDGTPHCVVSPVPVESTHLPDYLERMDATRPTAPALTFIVSSTVRAPSSAVWAVLGDFGTEHRWTRSVSHCERDTEVVRVGTSRTCTLPKPLMGRSKVREELIEYAPGEALAYKLEGPAGPFDTAASRWSIARDTDGGTIVTVEGRFTPRSLAARFLIWPVAKPMIRRLTRRVIAELGAFVVGQGQQSDPA